MQTKTTSSGSPLTTTKRRVRRLKGHAGTLALALLAAGGLGGTLAATAAAAPIEGSANYKFQTLDNNHDTTFNQLLGINDSGLIAGYFGSGEEGHPNKGYELAAPHSQGHYSNENFPHSAQTQVTGLNNHGVTVGFWVDKKGNAFGFDKLHGKFRTVDFPAKHAKPHLDQLLGVNDNDVAVGFYAGPGNVDYGYTYNIHSRRFRPVTVPGDTNVTAAAINDEGDVAGFATNSEGNVEGFLKRPDGTVIKLDFPGAKATQAFGINNGDEVVGAYTVGEATHGFAWVPGFGFETVNDPHGTESTTINGVNDRGDLVGFYTDSEKNTDGLLAIPR